MAQQAPASHPQHSGRRPAPVTTSSMWPGFALAVHVVALVLVLVLALGALSSVGHPLHRYDIRIEVRLRGFPGRHELGVIPRLLAPQVTGGLLLVVAAAVALISRRAGPLLVGLVGLAVIIVITVAVKALFGQPGPAGTSPDFGAYPSGHTVTAVTAVTLCGLLLRLPLLAAAGVGLTAGVVVGASMVVVASHYATDVVGGLLLGPALVVLTVAIVVLVTPWRPRGVPLATHG